MVDDATKIEVQFLGDEDDDLYAAKVIGKDALTDSALIQLTQMPKHALTEAKFGDSSQMAAGDWVMAIGNPFGYAHTVTVGVVSAVGRPYQATAGRSNEMIQTDAAINPGNSGGPLLNIRGEVIGINTAIISNERASGNIGIGFAVPINSVRDILPQLRVGQDRARPHRRLGAAGAARRLRGVRPEDAQRRHRRAGRRRAAPRPRRASSPATSSSTSTDVPVPNSAELVKMVVATKPGTSVPVKVLREKRKRRCT